MKLSKKQESLVALVRKCGYLFRSEVPNQKYPDSLIEALKKKGALVEFKNKLTIPKGISYE